MSLLTVAANSWYKNQHSEKDPGPNAMMAVKILEETMYHTKWWRDDEEK